MPWMSLEDAFRKDIHPEVAQQIYNALDTTGTAEVFHTLRSRLSNSQSRYYDFEMALTAPAFAMMRRGVLVDTVRRDRAAKDIRLDLRRAITTLNKLPIVLAKWDGDEKVTGKCPASKRKDGRHTWEKWEKGADEHGRKCTECGGSRFARSPLNAKSPDQVKHFLYDVLKAPEQKNKQKKVSADEDALLRVRAKRPDLHDLIDAILRVRDLDKQLDILEARLTFDGRFPSTFGIGPWTGRFKSSKSPLGGGGNMQNITARIRHIFIPDPGMEMGYGDLMKAESFGVAYLSGDQNYIEAHEIGDTHTYVARLLWPELPWNGDIKKDKKIASSLRPPWDDIDGHDYRFQSKRIQHGSNYGLTPPGIAMIAKIPQLAAELAQGRYFDAFPGIRGWQGHIRDIIQRRLPLFNPLGRVVRLFGRTDDKHTWRQGYAFVPQSLVADILNLAMWRIWHDHDPDLIQLLAQVHDAILMQWPHSRRDEAIRAIAAGMALPVEIEDYRGTKRWLTIPVELQAGFNWGKAGPDNERGLRDVDLPPLPAFLP